MKAKTLVSNTKIHRFFVLIIIKKSANSELLNMSNFFIF